MKNNKKIRIGLINVQSGIGTTKGYYQYLFHIPKYFFPHDSKNIKKIAKLAKKHKINVLAGVEVDQGSIRTVGVDQSLLLKHKSGLKNHIFFPTKKRGKFSNQGNAIFSDFPISNSDNYKLPGLGEPRYAGKVDLEVEGRYISFIVTHLSLEILYRKEQIEELSTIVNMNKNQVILAGDFNIGHEDELDLLTKSKLQKVYTEKTFPSWKPTKHLDYFFVSRSINILKGKVLEDKFSDHRLIIADVVFN